MMFHQNSEEGEPVHAWHFEVERQDVWSEPGDLFTCHIGVGSRANHFEVGILGECIGDCLTDERRVIDDEHADSSAAGLGGWAVGHGIDSGVGIRQVVDTPQAALGGSGAGVRAGFRYGPQRGGLRPQVGRTAG